MPIRRRSKSLSALLIAAALVAVGCQASVAPSPSVAVSEASPTVSSPRPSISETAEPRPTIRNPASPSATYVALQARIHDPDLTLTLPIGWATLPIATYRALIVSSRDVAPAKFKARFTNHLKDIDSGAVRLVASGPTGFGPWIGSILFEVDTGDKSLDAALARVEKDLSTVAPPATLEQRHVTFEFGEGERIVTTHALTADAPKGSIPARNIEYVIRLADGRTLWIAATGPEAAQGFDTLINASVTTLEPS